jgi:hypothetical protein
MRSAFAGGLRSGGQHFPVLQPDPGVEVEVECFAIERPHRVFKSVQQAGQLNVGPIEDFHDLTNRLRARRESLFVDFDQYPQAVSGIGTSHKLFGVARRPHAGLDADAFRKDKIDKFR